MKKLLVTKEEYEELGASAVQERFNDWSTVPDDAPPKQSSIKPISYIEHVKKYNVFGKEEDVIIEVQNSPEDSPNPVDQTPELADSSYSDVFEATSPSSTESEDSSPLSSQKTNETDEGYCGSSKSGEAKGKAGRGVFKKKTDCKIITEVASVSVDEMDDFVHAGSRAYI